MGDVGSMKEMLAEIYCKESGYCKGRGDSMHLIDLAIGMMGATPIAVISHGVFLRLSDLRKCLFLAESKIRHFEKKYKITLAQVEAHGFFDDADFEMHEDYVMRRHYAPCSMGCLSFT
jgi:hypothetical protein